MGPRAAPSLELRVPRHPRVGKGPQVTASRAPRARAHAADVAHWHYWHIDGPLPLQSSSNAIPQLDTLTAIDG